MTTRTVGANAMTLADWWATGPSDPDRYGLDPKVMTEALRGARISRQDVDAYRSQRVAAGLTAQLVPGAMTWALRDLYERWPQMSVRDAIGWILVFPTGGPIGRTLTPWVDAVGDSGWLFTAAGLTPAEARDMVAAGGVDEGALAALAALRGVSVPVTT